jgi:hypothetical protein
VITARETLLTVNFKTDRQDQCFADEKPVGFSGAAQYSTGMLLRWIRDALKPVTRRPPIGVFLSKSKYLVGLQCSKALWIHYNDRRVIPEFSLSNLALFEQGHEVGLLAQKLFPDGIDIGYISDPNEAIRVTRAQLAFRRPIFEAALAFEQCYSRADILIPLENGQWDIGEVKSSVDLKPIYFQDVAFQRYVYEGAGLGIRNCHLLHVNNSYMRNGPIDAKRFFSRINVTHEVSELLPQVEANVRQMLDVITSEKCPDIRISPHCNNPYECVLKPVCWSFLPQANVFQLRKARKKSWALFNRGITRLVDIPADFALSDIQARQVASHRSGMPHIDSAAITAFLRRLNYPLTFLDFETVQPAIPLYNQSRPYAKIPFQFSLHKIDFDGAVAQHHSFLAEGHSDPRPALLHKLRDLIPESGSIIGYNVGFEVSCLRECISVFPEYRRWFESIEPRFVDLYEIFESFDYYHPSQNGAASLKKVLPILTEHGYNDFHIQDGDFAQREFQRITFGNVLPDERKKVRIALENYCAQDTAGLVALLEAAKKL